MAASVGGDIACLTHVFGLDHTTWTEITESGVIAIDISDPAHPSKIEVYFELDEVSGVMALGDLVSITDTTRGLVIPSMPPQVRPGLAARP